MSLNVLMCNNYSCIFVWLIYTPYVNKSWTSICILKVIPSVWMTSYIVNLLLSWCWYCKLNANVYIACSVVVGQTMKFFKTHNEYPVSWINNAHDLFNTKN